ncbi:hypothetical protein HDV00_007939 [Rhizophlyctis rosea]|nr:hypothetical protein HDV00_007939 [Rhizophlyctis rosea]
MIFRFAASTCNTGTPTDRVFCTSFRRSIVAGFVVAMLLNILVGAYFTYVVFSYWTALKNRKQNEAIGMRDGGTAPAADGAALHGNP